MGHIDSFLQPPFSDPLPSPLAEVPLAPAVRRPSGLLVDVERRALYVLCLQGQKALVKYDLK